MLPSPSANFTLPSLYDDLELDCRLYFPRRKSEHGAITAQGCAIFAHPYAPLSGSFDDHVVHSIGSVLLGQGYILTTFNFRGSEHSPGKTSWSGRGELGDYVSVYALCVAMINVPGVLEHMYQDSIQEHRPTLLLGGYSYGSMVAAHLPAIDVVVDCLSSATDGSPEKEIENRAREVGEAFLGYCEAQQFRGREGRKTSDPAAPRGGVATFGGYESFDAAQKISRERSLRKVEVDRVRHSVERVRRRLSSNYSDSASTTFAGKDIVLDAATTMTIPILQYLLVSPLLGPIAGLATMFSKLKFERRGTASTGILSSTIPEETLSRNRALIVYGSSDHFTSSAKVRSWCAAIKGRPASQLESHEVQGAGHFWHDSTNEQKLMRIVSDWLTNSS